MNRDSKKKQTTENEKILERINMMTNTPHTTTEPKDRALKLSSQFYPLKGDCNAIRHSEKQLDLEGIRELILEMRI